VSLQRKTPLRRGPSKLKRTPLGHASDEQKAKVEREGLRIPPPWCDDPSRLMVDAAHITPRAIGGCDHEDCVLGLTRRQHRLYDNGELDILPYLTLEEQAHAASHVGLLGALKRTTGERYVPEERAA
jgi:hypothetical protein